MILWLKNGLHTLKTSFRNIAQGHMVRVWHECKSDGLDANFQRTMPQVNMDQ